MRRNFIWAIVFAISLLSSNLTADVVTFDFNNNTGFDGNAGVGATMSATGTTDTVTITSVGVFAPEFDEPTTDVFVLTGNTIAAGTSIASGTNAIGINNPSIGNTDFRTFKTSTMTGTASGTEGNDFNLGESWVLEFDTDVVINEFDFSSIDSDGFFVVEVEGVATPFNFVDGTSGDDFTDPLAGLVITAGTDVTFSVGGTSQDASVRITEITVETVAVPEPSSLLGLMGLAGLFAVKRRR